MTDPLIYHADKAELCCQGSWTVDKVSDIQRTVNSLLDNLATRITINVDAITRMDSAGALLLLQLQQRLDALGKSSVMAALRSDFADLLKLIQSERVSELPTNIQQAVSPVALLGRLALLKFRECLHFLGFLGHFILIMIAAVRKSHRIKWRSVFSVIDSAGYRALPIVALLTFLVGVVMTYQVALQLSNYGANIYVVDLTGMIIFREFGPLITAIIAAGRTSTAFAAQIATMKVNQEIDALETMGIRALVHIVLPKVIGLLIALPLLVVWADIFGVLGAMVMAKMQLSIAYQSFLSRFEHVIAIQQYMAGLVKVPFFALVIALVGSYQGFKASQNADSVGQRTTHSAVQSIFLIIIVDALFSVIFSIRGV